MPSAASHLSLFQVPLTPAPAILRCCIMEHSWKSTWCQCTCNRQLQGNLHPSACHRLMGYQKPKNKCFLLSSSKWMALMLISQGCSEDTAESSISHPLMATHPVRPIQEHTHVLAFSISLFNFSYSSFQHPGIIFQVNLFQARLSLRLCFEKNSSQSLLLLFIFLIL